MESRMGIIVDRKIEGENHIFKESDKGVSLVMRNEGGCCVKKSSTRRSGDIGKSEIFKEENVEERSSLKER